MNHRPGALFTGFFVGVTLLEILGDTLSIRWLHYVCKPLIMGLLLVYSWPLSRSEGHPGHRRWLLAGMVFALLGDGFLMIQEADLFAPGLGMFLCMQICYVQAFRPSLLPLRTQWFALTLLAFGVYLAGFLSVLRPAFAPNPVLQPLWWPVVVYAVCLCAMGLLAANRMRLPGWRRVFAGALLFMLSDSLIALDKFLVPIEGATWLIMSTYAAAQYLIVLGLFQPRIPSPNHTTNIP